MRKYEVKRIKAKGAVSAVLFCTLSFFLCPSRGSANDFDRLPAREARAYSLIVPTASELKWATIPWLMDLEEAIKVAKKEKRPLLIWTAGDDPLERC